MLVYQRVYGGYYIPYQPEIQWKKIWDSFISAIRTFFGIWGYSLYTIIDHRPFNLLILFRFARLRPLVSHGYSTSRLIQIITQVKNVKNLSGNSQKMVGQCQSKGTLHWFPIHSIEFQRSTPHSAALAQLSLGPTDRVLTSAADQTDGLLGPTEIQWDLMAYNRNIRNISGILGYITNSMISGFI